MKNTTKKIDMRKKYILMVDVETAGSLAKPLIYDLGFAIADKKGNIYEERSFIIEEIFANQKLMNSAYYAEKVPTYIKEINEGKHEVVSFNHAITEMATLVREYNVDTVCAYNLNFDMRAIESTSEHLLNNKITFQKLDKMCVWSFACEVIFSQKSYSKIAYEQGWFNPKTGNMLTNAEVCYRYITGNFQFKEEHKGLADVRIECKILAKCFAQKKKHDSGILSHPWRIPQVSNKKEMMEKHSM